ncbi:MAG: 5-formyltetrahydrofolate cyclo-ligase [Chryseobacterium sp. 39-10]|nr:5-formyltetrahydrofolate cyclo-ligase [Chryseobacterium sp.]OJV48324.1 MAG: 5-formyltetrahydrofolate cyclo-ligase [Chryseobacterium sp. 39-10]
MKKSELREKYLKKREALSKDEVLTKSAQIFENFVDFFKLEKMQNVHCFLSIPEKGEVDTSLFVETFFKHQVNVFVPKIVNKKMISVTLTADTQLKKNAWGITEPESNDNTELNSFDLVLTPLLYCDAHGNRVGYGKGYYDGFFEKLTPHSIKVGVSFFNPQEEIDDSWEKDIPLDYLVTPTEVLSFGGFTSKSTK